MFLPLALFGSITSDLTVGLQALQQIRVLIPERLSVEEFSILVDQKGMESSLDGKHLSASDLVTLGVGVSKSYYLRWTITGEPVRILDSYLEFEYGPYWLYPTAMERLQELAPDQNLGSGTQQMATLEPKFGELRYKGNKYSSPEQLRKLVDMKAGESIDGEKLVRSLAKMNQTPFRRTDAVWKPGAKPGTVDLELDTIDRFPYRFYMGADNTGTIATDRDRFFFGLNLGKTIVDDSELSYQFTCAPNWNRFIAQTALCRVPFPARQTFIFYGGYSQVEPELNDHAKEKSISWQVDGRYRIPIITNTAFL